MMNDLIILITVTSIWVLGLTIATQQNMVFYSIRRWAEGKTSAWYEPFIICIWCMPSVHSLFGYAFSYMTGLADEFSWNHVAMYPIVVMGSSFVCGMLWSLYLLVEAAIESYSLKSKINSNHKKERMHDYGNVKQ